ncbi:MetQ/NlpA family ABC transporter substrate-binding protein [Inquilinus limosus]|uniref:Lipoprotein n=1 Tax=Inquilinus limosus TaxID=171674 RepID=A0A211YZL9_9PROT|nr:MetQ/NlpA family ABC transporter substrate-binding protein [Inquilinus limosus]OWJ58317.1 metal ABC transporter substrate-binding protein [Inquilinus limosus]
MSLSPLKRGLFGLALGLALGAATAGSAFAASIKLGVMGGSEEEIAEVAKQVAAKKGLEIELITFSDYAIPNEALENGELDANAFQHKPYLDAQIAARGYHIVPIGFTIVEPIGLYSKKHTKLEALPDGAKIGIPNDPSNGGRALNLLAAHGLIKLSPGKGLNPSLLDVADNPHKFEFSELDAAQLSHALPDLDGAIINTDYALNAGLDPRKDALIAESRTDNPYGNFIAARAADKDRADLKILVESYQSPEVTQFLETRFKGAILPAW